MLNGFVWNSRGLGDKYKRDYICEMAKNHNLDFIGIQETIRQDFPQTMLLSMGGDIAFEWTWTPSRGRSGGILLGINTDTFNILEKEMGKYFIRILVHSKAEDFIWNLVIVYGDAQPTGKAEFLVELVHIIKKTQVPLFIAGDFNLTRRSSDKE